MKRNILRNLGTINIDKLEILGGQIEVFIPVEAVSDELDAVMTKCENSYRKNHPEVTNVAFNVNLVFTMGYANPEFELQIAVFDEDNGDTFEEFDSFFVGDIELSEEQKKQIKKVMWDELGKTCKGKIYIITERISEYAGNNATTICFPDER